MATCAALPPSAYAPPNLPMPLPTSPLPPGSGGGGLTEGGLPLHASAHGQDGGGGKVAAARAVRTVVARVVAVRAVAVEVMVMMAATAV